jgi:hypothetical protein
LLSTNITIKKYRTVILPLVLYGCVTWSLILRDERRLRVFENRVYRGICGLKRDEVRGNGEKYIVKSLMDLYCPQNIIRVIKSRRTGWAGHVARMGTRVAYTGFWTEDQREKIT